MSDVSAMIRCPRCDAAVYDDAAFCHTCGTSLARDEHPSRGTVVREFAAGALRQADKGAREIMKNPTAQKVAGTAALGAGIAIFVPFVTIAAGATLGAAWAGYKLLTSDQKTGD
jgi:hypothetical protein